MIKYQLLALALVIFISSAMGQDKAVTGTVVSDENSPLSKIKLTVEGLPFGDVTKKDGSFKLEKVQSDDIIVVQLKNKTNAKFHLGDCSTLKLIVSDDMVTVHRDGVAMEKALAQKKVYSSSGGANSDNIITAKMIERLHPRTVSEAIKMKSPSFNTQPVSINSGKTPLVYLDGVETTFDNIHSVPIQYVESIEINKHGDGYGARGAAGVIIVKTKK